MKLSEIMEKRKRERFATAAGNEMHAALRHIVIAPGGDCGDSDLIAHIRAIPNLADMFGADSRTEVPIAGTVNGKFISRRIDRLRIDSNAKKICFIDYKTDTDQHTRREKYHIQMREYGALLRQIFPDYEICAQILWLHNWVLEPVRID